MIDAVELGLRDGLAATSVLILTMLMDQDWLDEMFAAGASGATSKATNPAILSALIRETINDRLLNVHRPVTRAGAAVAHCGGWLVPHGARTGGASLRRYRLDQRRHRQAALGDRPNGEVPPVERADGATNGEIAQKLSVTEQTVKFHLSNVYCKLEVGNRTEASHYAHINGLIGTPELAAT